MADAPEVNILLLGDAECGKSTFLSFVSLSQSSSPLLSSSLALRISQGPNNNSSSLPKHNLIPLLKDINQPFVFDISVKGTPYRFQLYDTASPESWTLLTPHVVILCYDISSRLSLMNVQRLWTPQIPLTFPSLADSLPVLLLGLKRDLRSEHDPNGIMYPQEAYRVAQELRCDKYMECSAVSGELLAEVWEDVCRTAVRSVGGAGAGLSEGGCGVM
ncbi:GTP-binding protein rhoA [Lachnellula arida]|uniref:GTP-binding protein rhoA n=1 Tax=Lachnellula arida TaxID=1316785 RepID=A0A8T9B3Y7_9HELO|nr:GTP-binding protein rhoA [Lachnellula arida]